MILEIKKEVIDKIGGNLLPEENVEAKFIKHYALERNEDPYTIIAKYYLNRMYEEEQPVSKITTFFSPDTFISKVTSFVETIDIVLLNKCDHVDFRNIVYLEEKNDIYYFKVIEK